MSVELQCKKICYDSIISPLYSTNVVLLSSFK